MSVMWIIVIAVVAIMIVSLVVVLLQRLQKLKRKAEEKAKLEHVRSEQLKYDCMATHGWEQDLLFKQRELGERYIYFSADVPIEHDELDVYLLPVGLDERSRRLFKEHHDDFQDVLNVHHFRFINLLRDPCPVTLGDVSLSIDQQSGAIEVATVAPLSFEEIVRRYGNGYELRRPAFLHFQPIKTEQEYMDAQQEGREARVVYSVYYIEQLPMEPRPDCLDSKLGPVTPDRLTDEYALQQLISELRTMANNVRNYHEVFYSAHLSDEARAYYKKKKEVLERLRTMNAPESLIEEVERLYYSTKTVELVITDDFDIYVPRSQEHPLEGERMTVELTPLAKVLYFLYLRHEEGIPFKQLSGYRNEMMELYSLVSHRESTEGLQRSIERLTDVTNNSVNENCSRIKNAFMRLDNPGCVGIRSEFYITGVAGGARRVVLNRRCIVDQSGLILRQPRARFDQPALYQQDVDYGEKR